MDMKNPTMKKETGLKPRRFTRGDIADTRDEISEYTWALKATGALLEATDLSHKFGEDWKDSSQYRYGLGVIIETFTNQQEKALKKLCDKYDQSLEPLEDKQEFSKKTE